MGERDAEIRITAKNLTAEEFAKVKASVSEMRGEILKAGPEGQQSIGKLRVALDNVPPGAINAKNSMKALGDQLGAFSAGAKTIGAGLTAAVTAPILGVAAAAIKLGMDAVESENLVSVSFGDMKGKAEDWSKDLSKNLGLNQFELRKTAGTIFNMTTSMGINREAAFDMSTGVAKLAADMSSFRNIPMEEALLKIRSGLTGEAEPLKAIGILVDDATIKTFAYTNGIAKQGAELTQQQKVMARWGAILQQTKNDQGDLARTMDSPANQLRIMETRLEEAATALGVQLMPMVQQFIGWISKAVPYVQDAVKWFGGLPEPVKLGSVALFGLVAAGGPAIYMLGGLAGSIKTLLPLMTTLSSAQAIGGLTGVLGMLSNPVVAAAVATIAAGGGALLVFHKNLAELEARAASANKPVKDIAGNILYTVEQARAAAAALPPASTGFTFLGKAINESKQAASGDGFSALTKQLADARKEIDGLSKMQLAQLNAALKSGAVDMGDLTKSTGLSDTALKLLKDRIQDADQAEKKAAETSKKHREERAKLVEKVRELEIVTSGLHHSFGELDSSELKSIEHFLALNKQLDDIERHTHTAVFGAKGLADGLEGVGIKVDVLSEKQKQMAARAQTDYQKVYGAIGNVNTILSNIPGKFAEIGSMAARTGQAIMDNLASGNLWGAVTSGVAGAIGIFKNLFAGSEESRLVNKPRDAFIAQFGDLGGLNKQIMAATGSLTLVQQLLNAKTEKDYKAAVDGINGALKTFDDREKALSDTVSKLTDRLRTQQQMTPGLEAALQSVYDAKNPTEYEAALRNVNAVLDDQDARSKRLDAAMQKYGITWDQLGEKARAAKLAQTTHEVGDEFDVLIDAGVDVGTIIGKMKDKVQEVIDKARDSGTEVPESFRRIIQAAIDAGQVFDADGNKVTDLTQLGLTFGSTQENVAQQIVAGFDKVVAKFDELFQKIGSVTGRINAIPRNVNVDVGVNYREEGWRAGDESDYPGHARGGVFHREHLARIAEAEPEIVGGQRFMRQAIAGALADLRMNGAPAAVAGGGDIVIHHQTILDGKVIDERIERVGQDRLGSGRWRVPPRAIVSRVR